MMVHDIDYDSVIFGLTKIRLRYALEFPVPPADLIALSPGYRVPPDLATVPYVPRYTRFALTEAATSDQMFEMTLPAP